MHRFDTLVNFMLINWSSIIAVASFAMSVYLLLDKLWNQRFSVSVDDTSALLVGSNSIYLCLAITNHSSRNIGVFNFKLNQVDTFRREHHFVTNKEDELMNISTTPFPMNLGGYETKIVLIEFDREKPWENDLQHASLDIFTSRKTKHLTKNLSECLLNFDRFEKIVSR